MSRLDLIKRRILRTRLPEDDDGTLPSVRPLTQPLASPPRIAAPGLQPLSIHYYDIRRHRVRRLRLQFFLFVVLPTLLAVIYCGFLAAPRYVSQVQGEIETPNTLSNSGGGSLGAAGSGLASMGGLFGGSAVPGATSDIVMVENYINSPQIITELERDIGLRSLFSSTKVDWLARVPADAAGKFFASSEYFDWYWRWWVVDTSLDQASGLLTFYVTAFSPEDARKIAQAIVGHADHMLNSTSKEMRDDALNFAKNELTVAENRLSKADLALERFRNEHREFDPTKSATDLTTVVSGLEATLASYKAELANDLTYMSRDAAPVRMLRNEISSTAKQIAEQRERFGNTAGINSRPDTGVYSKALEEYTALQTEKGFSLTAYNTAAADMELARQNAQRKQSYFIAYVSPTTPQRSTEPDPILEPLAVFGVCLFSFGVIKLISGGFREHFSA